MFGTLCNWRQGPVVVVDRASWSRRSHALPAVLGVDVFGFENHPSLGWPALSPAHPGAERGSWHTAPRTSHRGSGASSRPPASYWTGVENDGWTIPKTHQTAPREIWKSQNTFFLLVAPASCKLFVLQDTEQQNENQGGRTSSRVLVWSAHNVFSSTSSLHRPPVGK